MISKIVSEYDQEIPQSQTADNPVAPRGRAARVAIRLLTRETTYNIRQFQRAIQITVHVL